MHSQNVAEKDKHKVIIPPTPPYGGKMAQEMQTNFRVRSSATECLFLQHIMANLPRVAGPALSFRRASFPRWADQKVRKELLSSSTVHHIVTAGRLLFAPIRASRPT